MITIFSRKELLITMDIKRQANVRNILAANGIEYIVKVTNIQNSSIIGSYGTNQNYLHEYKIYVHKKDYEKALYLIG